MYVSRRALSLSSLSLTFLASAVLLPPSQEVYIDAVNNTIDMRVSEEVLAKRKAAWKPREPKVKSVSIRVVLQLEAVADLSLVRFPFFRVPCSSTISKCCLLGLSALARPKLILLSLLPSLAGSSRMLRTEPLPMLRCLQSHLVYYRPFLRLYERDSQSLQS